MISSYPDLARHLEIARQEAGALKRPEKKGLLRSEYGGVTIPNLERLRHHGE